MEITTPLILGIIIGLLIGLLIGMLLSVKANSKVQTLTKSLEQTKQHNMSEMQALKESHEKETALLKEQSEDGRRNAEQLRQESDKQWNDRLEAMKHEVQRLIAEQQKTAADQLAAGQSALQENNRVQMSELLKPVKEQFEAFRKSVEENKTASEVNKNEIKGAFTNALDLFRQEQQQTVAALREETSKIGTDAANLTKALKGDTKLQGNWGEMVLESLLEKSGLRKNEEYLVQSCAKGEAGNTLRPDVIVKLPGNRNIIVDSKVSLTAYAAAVSTDKEEEKKQYLKQNTQSLRKHVDELSGKNYGKAVDGAIGYVLMFVPIESCLIAAIESDPSLYNYAYDKKIVIISPTSLLMALQLAYNLWQNDRQSKNVENVMKAAADLYDKAVVFQKSFTDIGDKINALAKVYETAQVQFCQGNGNLIRRVENLKSLGVTPHKQLKAADDSE